MGMNNIKVRTKLVIVMVIALIALALCAVISNTSLSGLGNNALDIIENDMRSSYDEQIKAQAVSYTHLSRRRSFLRKRLYKG